MTARRTDAGNAGKGFQSQIVGEHRFEGGFAGWWVVTMAILRDKKRSPSRARVGARSEGAQFSFASSLPLRRIGSPRALPASSRITQRLERRSHFGGEDRRLLPGREVAAFVEPVVVNELGIGSLRPAPRGRIDLVGKGAHRDGYGDAFRGEEGAACFPNRDEPKKPPCSSASRA